VNDDADFDRLRFLLHGERRQWEEFGVRPGMDSVHLLTDALPEMVLDRHETAFLFAVLASHLAGEVDEGERADLEFVLGDLGDRLFAAGEGEVLAPLLGIDSLSEVSVTTLQDLPGVTLHTSRARTGVTPENTLYVLLVADRRRSIEVVVKPGEYNVAAFDDPQEAKASLSRWIREERWGR
jgi:hypothetical protein